MIDRFTCPKCGSECQRDEADIGVGTMYGPWGCPNCAWSEAPEYDNSIDLHIDQYGGFTPSTPHAETNESPEHKPGLV